LHATKIRAHPGCLGMVLWFILVAKAQPPSPVKLFVAVLTRYPALVMQVSSILEAPYGPLDLSSQGIPFTATHYYEAEMGTHLQRFFLSFSRLIPPDQIVEIKAFTSEVEDRFRQDGKRQINLDPGYLDYHKVVLASWKFGGQKIYLPGGVYADITLYYYKRQFLSFEWSFPDFKLGLYNDFLLKMRDLYKAERQAVDKFAAY